jgi:hypothetical protein
MRYRQGREGRRGDPEAGTKTFWGGYNGYFADPDGHLWEIAFNPHRNLDAQGLVELPE